MFRETFTTEERYCNFLTWATLKMSLNLNPAMWGIKNQEKGSDKVICKCIQNKNMKLSKYAFFQYSSEFLLSYFKQQLQWAVTYNDHRPDHIFRFQYQAIINPLRTCLFL